MSAQANFLSQVTLGADRVVLGNAVGVNTSTPSYPLDVLQAGNTYTTRLTNSNADPFGLRIIFSGATPNDVGHYFWVAEDASAPRGALLSNGGLANFAANNINLSDERVKVSTGPARSQRAAFRQLERVEGRYQDSRRDVDDVMVTAQNVEQVYPELVETFPGTEDLKGVREHGLLMRALKVIQELDAVIEDQAATIAALMSRVAALEGGDGGGRTARSRENR